MSKPKAKPKRKAPHRLPAEVREAVKALPPRKAEPEPRRKTIQEVVAERDRADALWRRLFVDQPKAGKGAKRAARP